MYDKLPEVVKRREDEQRKARYMKNRILMKQYDQVGLSIFFLSKLLVPYEYKKKFNSFGGLLNKKYVADIQN